MEELPRLLLIIGCQRSGTTLMTQIFEKDWEVQVYPEHSRLSNQDKLDKLRLNPLLEVKDTLSRSRFPLVVLKPLVETQNAQELLNFFDDARALWMFRHYADVANSNLNRFGLHNGIRNLSYIAYNNDTNWRSERVSEAVQDLVDRYFSEDMNPFDAAALFWYIRNSYFFDQQLVAHPRVMMLRYNDLTANPVETMKQIYTHVGQSFPGRQIVS
ncbi:MAG: sulfotransferase, partial [Ardenticatenaceae bacterium]|nr:sulfotransferase [Ardenticatenaceae bacterium]